jgi:ribonuclease E
VTGDIVDGQTEGGTDNSAGRGEAGGEPGAEGERQEGGRRRRSRDRTRREREGSEGVESVDKLEAPLENEGFADTVPSHVSPKEVFAQEAPSTFSAPAAPAAVQPAPAAIPVAQAAPPAVAPVLPREPFVLPIDALHGIAQTAGLEWVNSNADKIRSVQEAIASEPRPAHVPRERKPPVVLDEGPLILVETRKDLSQVTLPFENAA